MLCSVAQYCLTLCDSMDSSPPGSTVHETLQQEYWSGLPFPRPGHLPNPEMEPMSPASPALSGIFFPSEPLEKH